MATIVARRTNVRPVAATAAASLLRTTECVPDEVDDNDPKNGFAVHGHSLVEER
jgi:hypothetical protein